VTELLNNGASNAEQDSKISSSAINQTEKQTLKFKAFKLCNENGNPLRRSQLQM
jgi:hypothetical protein